MTLAFSPKSNGESLKGFNQKSNKIALALEKHQLGFYVENGLKEMQDWTPKDTFTGLLL